MQAVSAGRDGARGPSWLVAPGLVLILVGSWLMVGWLNFWAAYAWEAEEHQWLVKCGVASLLMVGLAVLVAHSYNRRLRSGPAPWGRSVRRRTQTADSACGLFAILFVLGSLVSAVVFLFWAWAFWHDGHRAASLYFLVVVLAMCVQPAAFVVYWGRWRRRAGLN